MKHSLAILFSLLVGHLLAQGNDPAALLRSALKATEKLDTIEYEVKQVFKTPDGKLHHYRSTIVAARSPLGFSARFEDEDTGTRDMAVLDGEVTRYSDEGIAGEVTKTFTVAGQVVPNHAAQHAAATFRLLLDREYVSTAITSGNVVYGGRDDVEGEPCRVVMYVRIGEDSGSTADWYWISTKTGLPRATQRVTLRRGTTRLADRLIISILRTNPRIAPDTFTYRPMPGDSTPSEPFSEGPLKNLRGTRLPDLETKDVEYRSVKLSEISGTPLLITFWAPWCYYCLEEMKALTKLEPRYQGKLRVVAIAVQDSRANVVSWIKEHPQYDFMFLSDPDLPEKTSAVSAYFDVNGIPVSVLVGTDGTVIENWRGFKALEELEKRLDPFLKTPAK